MIRCRNHFILRRLGGSLAFGPANALLWGYSCQGSQASATAWQDSGGVHIRLYATFEDNTTEWCYDDGSGWQVGQYSKP